MEDNGKQMDLHDLEDLIEELRENTREALEDLSKDFSSTIIAVIQVLHKRGLVDGEEMNREIISATHTVDQEWEEQKRALMEEDFNEEQG